MTSESIIPKPDKPTALVQYQIVAGYLQYENSAYWQRATVLIAIQAVYFGLLASMLPLIGRGVAIDALAPAVASISGLLISILSLQIINKSTEWIEKWTSALRKIEPNAFDFTVLFRETPITRIKDKTEDIIKIFIFLWILTLVYLMSFSLHSINKMQADKAVVTTAVSAPQ